MTGNEDTKAELVALLRSGQVAEFKRRIAGLGADLSGADLSRLDLPGADLHGANLRLADLRGANLSGADLHGANLRLADLSGANLSGADLHGVDLFRASATRARLTRANLRGANLEDLDLKRAKLDGADLTEANLSGVDLRTTSLEKTSFRRAINTATLWPTNVVHPPLRTTLTPRKEGFRFFLTHSGPTVDAGTMDVQVLAATVTALGRILNEVHAQINPNDEPLELEIEATESGSFVTHLLLTHPEIGDAVQILTGDDVRQVIDLAKVFSKTIDAIAFIRKLGSGNSTDQRQSTDATPAKVTIEDSEIQASSAGVFPTGTFRQSVHEFTRPVRGPFRSILLGTGEVESVRTTELEITSSDANHYAYRGHDARTSWQVTQWLAVVAADPKNSVWGMSECGDGLEFPVEIQDQDFLQEVRSGQTFDAGDLLQVSLRTEQSRTESGDLVMSRVVTKVIDHWTRE